MTEPVLRVRRLREDARLPMYATSGAAGMDLTAVMDHPIELVARAWAAVPTGLAIELPPGHEGQVRPRSGLAAQRGITVLNAPGTIDEDYRGEVRVLLVNLSNEPVVIHPGDRVAQLVVAPVTKTRIEETAELTETERQDGGFGSTGRR